MKYDAFIFTEGKARLKEPIYQLYHKQTSVIIIGR